MTRDMFARGAVRAAQWVVRQDAGFLRYAGCARTEIITILDAD